MPTTYKTDSLSVHSDLIGSLTTEQIEDDLLYVNCNDCEVIPFCGYLRYRNDSIFFSKNRDKDFKLFLSFNAQRLVPYTVEYTPGRVDRVTNYGLMFDERTSDSLHLFLLNPVEWKLPADATYLKYIAIKDGGIKHFTFSSGNAVADHTIELSKFAFVRNINRYPRSMIKLNSIPGTEVRSLIKDLSGKMDASAFDKYFVDVYRLSDGRAVMDFDTHGFLFANIHEVEEYLLENSREVKSGRAHHILDGVFPYDNSFLLKTDSLIAELFKSLGKENVSYTKAEIGLVDKIVNEKLKEELNPEPLVPGLIAYIGEYMIRNIPGGKWQMVYNTEFAMWEPYIVDANGNRYNPYSIVYEELYEYFPEEGKVSLADQTVIELIKYRKVQ